MWSLSVFILALVVASITCQGQNPQVSTVLGDVVGSTLKTRLNKTIYAFRGIRYAKAPVGDLRFQPPVPVEKWSGVYNATTDGPLCPQPNLANDPISEDCLFLNVYTTKLPNFQTNPKLSVIIFLHPGGFYSFTGRSNWFGPQYLLDQNVVLVTFNYRLGSLGFISTGKDAPGNNGLKDQVVVLKWVKNNIRFFGGDPNSVSLYGYSAGSGSVNLHLVSPMSRGLFHRAIMRSSSVLGQFSVPNNQLDLAKKQAKLVGCPDNVSPKQMLDCLKTIPAETLGNSLESFAEFGYDPIIIWYPVVEGDYGQERFIAEDPLAMFERGDFAKVPVILGVTEKEFGYEAFNVLILNKTLFFDLNTNFDKYAPISFIYERGTPRSKQISAALRNYYFGFWPITILSFDALSNLYADSITGFPINRAANVLAAKNSEPVYYYHFTYRSRYSFFTFPIVNLTWGTVHHDDLIYLFYISIKFPFFDKTYPEIEMVEKLTTLWATFAKTGKPIPQNSTLFKGLTWQPYNNSTKKYLDIGNEIVLRERLYEERYGVWDKLFPIKN